MRYYAVIDTNVLVSAMLKWDSVPGRVMQFVFDGTIIPLLHPDITKEYREVLSRPKFHLSDNIIERIVNGIERQGVYISAEPLDMEFPDPKDRVFYEVVMTKRQTDEADLVTGNLRHFPSEPFIVTPRQMLEIVQSSL